MGMTEQDKAAYGTGSPVGIIAVAWVQHSMEERRQPNEHDLANADAVLAALAGHGYLVVPEAVAVAGADALLARGDNAEGTSLVQSNPDASRLRATTEASHDNAEKG